MQHTRKRAGLLKSALLGAATIGALSLAGAGVAQAGTFSFDFSTLQPNTPFSCTSGGTNGDCVLSSSSETYSKTFGGTSYSLTASGNTNETSGTPTRTYASGTPTLTNLAQRFGSNANEVGLGVWSSNDNTSGSQLEIGPGEFLVLDVNGILNAQPPGSVTGISLGSIQSGEGGAVFTTSSLTGALSSISSYLNGGSLGTNVSFLQKLNSGTNGGAVSQSTSLTGVDQYLIISADNLTGANGSPNGNVLVETLGVTTSVPQNAPEPGSLALLGTGLLGLGFVIRRRHRKA